MPLGSTYVKVCMCDLDQKNMMKNPKYDNIILVLIGVHHRHLLLEDPTPRSFVRCAFCQ